MATQAALQHTTVLLVEAVEGMGCGEGGGGQLRGAEPQGAAAGRRPRAARRAARMISGAVTRITRRPGKTLAASGRAARLPLKITAPGPPIWSFGMP